MRNRRSLTVVTNLITYENVLITSLVNIQDWRTARVLDFRADIQEIITAGVRQTELAEADIQEGGSRQQASPPVERGTVQAGPAEDIFTADVVQFTPN